MRISHLFVVAGLFAAPALVIATAADGGGKIAPDSRWSVSPEDGCVLSAKWNGGTEILVEPNFGSGDYGFKVIRSVFKKLGQEQSASAQFAAAGNSAVQETSALIGIPEGKVLKYFTWADDALLEAYAQADSLQFYRDDVLEMELDMTGIAAALDEMQTCAVTPDPEKAG